jgi:hypothetical protein
MRKFLLFLFLGVAAIFFGLPASQKFTSRLIWKGTIPLQQKWTLIVPFGPLEKDQQVKIIWRGGMPALLKEKSSFFICDDDENSKEMIVSEEKPFVVPFSFQHCFFKVIFTQWETKFSQYSPFALLNVNSLTTTSFEILVYGQ